jgi:hypothetical protein
MYVFRIFVTTGGLMSYGIDVPDIFRKAAAYADRVLRGAVVGELPVQAPTKFEFAINLKVAPRTDDPAGGLLDLANPVTPASGGVWISGDTGEGERILNRGRDLPIARMSLR